MLRPIQRQSLADQAFAQLRDRILENRFRPGEHLPSERELADILGINRSSVREALKRLEQARLIDIRHGEGSIVLDFQKNAGLDLLAHLVAPGGNLNAVALRSIAEVRLLIAVEISRLAALRAEDPEIAAAAEIVARIGKLDEDDLASLQALDFEFHYVLARAGQNLALVLIVNSIRDLYAAYSESFAPMFGPLAAERDLYRKLLAAIASHETTAAQSICTRLIETGNRAILALCEDAAALSPLSGRATNHEKE